jgi:hypothetical protein
MHSTEHTASGGDGETLPATRAACRQRLAAIEDAIAGIKAQIAAADLRRQAGGRAIDADWFHRSRTALRHRQRERADLLAHMARLPRERDLLKDNLIAVLRERHDDAAWAAVMDEAHRRVREGM